jgi:hypothetical protein
MIEASQSAAVVGPVKQRGATAPFFRHTGSGRDAFTPKKFSLGS